ncbi:MAG: hypothetical protein KDA81_14155, partial [Planctomycetaceae bacterium]|nr:hypothetical protein [Planctomycetaceae bacterium]
MSRRTSQSSISLFPFLAVLVCTMGALILLLLVTTRRIRNDQVRWTERFQVTARVADENGLTKVTDEADFVIEPKRDVLHDGLTEEQRRELTALREQLQAEQEKYDQLQEQLGDSQSQLQVALDDREALRDRAEKLAELRRKEQQIRRTLEERAAELAGLQEELEDVSESTEQAQKVLRTRKSALVSLRKLVSEKSQSDSGTTGTVIEFSNSTGTKRTPLLINVSDDGFRFLPSGIRLTAADMQGFPSNDNPLVSGVLSIHQLRHHDSGAIKPYVLLLVRPSGSMQFYLAQR